jgi:hypothetical protein
MLKYIPLKLTCLLAALVSGAVAFSLPSVPEAIWLVEWKPGGGGAKPCDDAYAQGRWTLTVDGNPEAMGSLLTGTGLLGAIVQKVERNPLQFSCGETPMNTAPVSYYEWMLVMENKDIDDTLSSGIIPHDVWGREYITGASIFIPYTANTALLLGELQKFVNDNYNKKLGPGGRISVTGSGGVPLCTGFTTCHSGKYPNGQPEPEFYGAKFSNNFSGLGVPLPTRTLAMTGNCCDPPGRVRFWIK